MALNMMVGIPCHSGSVVVQCASTLLAALEIVKEREGAFSFYHYGGAVISPVRNAIAAEFLRSDADLLFMLDSDQGIRRDTLERMIDLNQPVVGCLYPMRRYNWTNIHLEAGQADSDLIRNQALTFVGCLEADENGEIKVVDGFARADHVGTGAMMVRRAAFETLMANFPELQGCGFGNDTYPNLEPNWGFFNPVFREDGLPLSEDISFCRRWRQTGGAIWADVVGSTTHAGLHSFTGSYMDSWKAHTQT